MDKRVKEMVIFMKRAVHLTGLWAYFWRKRLMLYIFITLPNSFLQLLIDVDRGCLLGTVAFFLLLLLLLLLHCAVLRLLSQWDTFDMLPKTQLTKNCGSPLLNSRPSPFHWALDVWWSNPDIFYILMQNKQSQITHILPPVLIRGSC